MAIKNFAGSLVKFILAICIFPISLAVVLNFPGHLSEYPNTLNEYFLGGVGIFLVVYLFIYKTWNFFDFGQRMMETLFQFMAPLNKAVARTIPFYVTLIFVITFVVRFFFNTESYNHIFAFLFGLASIMHVILVSKEYQGEDKDSIKPAYLFGMQLILIFHVFYLTLGMDLAFGESTVGDLFKTVWKAAEYFYERFLPTSFRG